MTTVLPVPVAIFEAETGQAIVMEEVLMLQSRAVVTCVLVPTRNLRQKDRCFCCFSLAEEDRLIASWWISTPMEEELSCVGCDAGIVASPPKFDFSSDLVDQVVLLDSFTCGIEIQLDLFASPSTSRWRWYRYKRFAGPTAIEVFTWGPMVSEFEVLLRHLEWRVEDGILDALGRHRW